VQAGRQACVNVLHLVLMIFTSLAGPINSAESSYDISSLLCLQATTGVADPTVPVEVELEEFEAKVECSHALLRLALLSVALLSVPAILC